MHCRVTMLMAGGRQGGVFGAEAKAREAREVEVQLRPLESKQLSLVVSFLHQSSQEAGIKSSLAAAARCDNEVCGSGR